MEVEEAERKAAVEGAVWGMKKLIEEWIKVWEDLERILMSSESYGGKFWVAYRKEKNKNYEERESRKEEESR